MKKSNFPIRKNISVVLINLLTVIIVIGAGELLCGFYLNNPTSLPVFLTNAFRQYYLSHDRSIAQVTDCAKYDSELFYTLAPGNCTFQNREFNTNIEVNSQGIRDDESSLNAPDVVVIGDSFSMGWGVNQLECYPHILEQELDGVKVLNASISSYGTAREMILLDRLGQQSPDYLIIQYHPSDFSENLEYVNSGNKLNISPKSTYDSLRNSVESQSKYFIGKHISQILKYYIKDFLKTKKEIDVDLEVDSFIKVLTNSHIKLDSTQILLFEIEHITTLNDQFIDALKAEIKSEEKHPPFLKNMKMISMTDLMTDGDFFILDDHMNAKGHQRVASLLNKHLRTKF